MDFFKNLLLRNFFPYNNFHTTFLQRVPVSQPIRLPSAVPASGLPDRTQEPKRETFFEQVGITQVFSTECMSKNKQLHDFRAVLSAISLHPHFYFLRRLLLF